MRLRIVVLQLLLVVPLICAGDETSQRYERLVDEVLEITGALKISEQMSDFVVGQMVIALKSAGTDLPDRAYDLMESEVQSTISDAIASGSFNELMYPIYAKYLDESDLEAMIRFYKTKEGQKIAAVMPLMTQEGMAVGQTWGAALGPEIARRVKQRLSQEGIEMP